MSEEQTQAAETRPDWSNDPSKVVWNRLKLLRDANRKVADESDKLMIAIEAVSELDMSMQVAFGITGQPANMQGPLANLGLQWMHHVDSFTRCLNLLWGGSGLNVFKAAGSFQKGLMRRCPKHFWKNILVHHEFVMDTEPFATNEVFGFSTPYREIPKNPTIEQLEKALNPPMVDTGFRIEICSRCRKVRSPK